jgi:hypothetical protein
MRAGCQQRRQNDRSLLRACVEAMEVRLHFSAALNPPLGIHYAIPAHSDVSTAAIPAGGGGSATAPFTPAQIRHFYGLDAVSLNGITGDGSGQTIGIVDAYDQPDMLDSTDPNFDISDLHLFDQQFGLPDPPSFTKVDEFGGTNLPTDYDSGWAIEISLDVEWAHAIAPAASIVLVECNSASYEDLLTYGAATAGQLASVVSMSFVGQEFNGDSYYDSAFTARQGVTFVAAAGDSGSGSTGYPAFSPDVLAVGGTQITTSDSNGGYGSEAVWNDRYGATGGAVSSVTPKPDYQSNVTISSTARVVPDVAFDAAPSTGVYVYDSSQSPTSHLYQVGGTSLSSPCWAGILAITNQARALIGLGTLSGRSETLPRLYQLPSTDFNDITAGDNYGYSAGPGYDACTGLGTPIAPLLIPDLAGGDTISGRVFQDNNGNGTFDGTDTPFAGQTVFLDLNNDGIQEANEPTAMTNASGYYSFTDQIGGETGSVLLAADPIGFVQVQGSTPLVSSYGSSQSLTTALFPIQFTDSAGSASYSVGLNASGTRVQISIDGTVEFSAAATLPPSLTFDLTGAGDGLTVDGSNGNPVPTGGISLTGAAEGDPLTVIGTTSENDAFTVTSSSIAFGSKPINFSNVSKLLLNPGVGTDSLTVNSGSVTIAGQSPGLGILTRQFSAITVAANSSAIFANAASHDDRMLVICAALSVDPAAMLDLGGNDMIIQNGDLAAITALLGSGYNNGAWTGRGIASSAAANDPTSLTALGVIDNTGAVFGPSNLFDGYAPAVTDILVKYTWYGDTNLDGQVDGSDYTRIDNGFNNQLTGWENGDFSYDSIVDGSDYTLIDNAFNSQGTPL